MEVMGTCLNTILANGNMIEKSTMVRTFRRGFSEKYFPLKDVLTTHPFQILSESRLILQEWEEQRPSVKSRALITAVQQTMESLTTDE